MEVIRIKKGDFIVRQRQRVTEWYIIQEGTALFKYDFVEGKLGANSIIGILEQDWFMCDYIASTDVTLIVFPCMGVQDLKKFLTAEPKMRRIFLRSSLIQRHQLLCLYADFLNRSRQFQQFVDVTLNDYNVWCAKNKVEARTPQEVNQQMPLEITHKAENWEMSNSNSLVKSYLDEYLNLLEKDENLCIASIMEVSAQMHRVVRGLGEMVSYLNYNRDILLSQKKHDLFHALFELEIKMKTSGEDATEVEKRVAALFILCEKLGVYSKEILEESKKEYETSVEFLPVADTEHTDDLAYILDYAGYVEDEKISLYQTIASYRKAVSAGPKDEEAYQLRKKINVVFYDIYERCFFAAMESQKPIPLVLEMFFNFGYMDTELLGEEKTDALYSLATHLDLCKSEHVFTIFDWLKMVYTGEREPSKNEFDMDFNAYLMDLYKNGEITKENIEVCKADQELKTQFEIQNMFKTVNRLTNGNIMMFCPILTEQDIFNDFGKMLVSATRVQDALDNIRRIDYSVFYRELSNHGLANEMSHELLMAEILPDVILMPNVGSRGMMWQETASVRNDTPARFMFPIFATVDLNEMMIEITGRYRWEICRKIQGVHWNDITDRSLTSEYCDYLQFYRKNRELSAETKEQIKSSLVRAKNNFREVFVKDYQNWIKYESKGGFRLNKYVRKIVFIYCPFSRGIREDLKSNPSFTDCIAKHDMAGKQAVKRLNGLYEKYKQSGGTITEAMKDNYHYYEM